MLRFLVGLAGASLIAASAAHAGVVIKSSGPSAARYTVGMQIDDNARIELEDGDVVTIVTARGTRVLSGPGRKRVSSNAASRRSTFAVFTRERSAEQAKIGGIRGEGSNSVENPSLWNVDLTAEGAQCVVSTEFLTTWRPQVSEQETYILGVAGSDFHTHVTFEKDLGEAVVLGGDLPLLDGKTYTISGPDGSPAKAFELAVIDEAPRDIPAMATLLIEKGCMRQLELLSEKVRQTD